tara:strand:+ start:14491 stop:14778 length:288 start_codon:yes stop_codon:yes gene_type:complete
LHFEHFNIQTISIVKTSEEIKALMKENPYPTENTKELYFILLSETPILEKVETSIGKDYNQGAFVIINYCIYIQCINGFRKTKKLTIISLKRNYN